MRLSLTKIITKRPSPKSNLVRKPKSKVSSVRGSKARSRTVYSPVVGSSPLENTISKVFVNNNTPRGNLLKVGQPTPFRPYEFRAEPASAP